MRENRTSGSEGGGAEPNRPFLPLSGGEFFMLSLYLSPTPWPSP